MGSTVKTYGVEIICVAAASNSCQSVCVALRPPFLERGARNAGPQQAAIQAIGWQNMTQQETSIPAGRQAILAANHAGVSVSVDGSELVLAHDGEIPPDILVGLEQHKAEILKLLSPIRPAFYSDGEWLAAIADAERLRYPFKLRKAGG
jgi:hypothetical protein